MAELDLDVFGYNDLPFVEYLEPEGFKCFPKKRTLQLNDYLKAVPATCDFGTQMLQHLDSRWRWGVQLSDGRWRTEIASKSHKNYETEKCIPGHQLGLLAIAKSLCGKSYAFGTTNLFDVVAWYDPDFDVWGYNYEPVSTLRIDVDMKKSVWLWEFERELRCELDLESQLAKDFGFDYYVFKTGNRGQQIVMPLPCKVNHPVASFLMTSFINCLSSRTDKKSVETIKDHALNKILRMPFGRHAVGRNLGLFIDHDNFVLYGLEDQQKVFLKAFTSPNRVDSDFANSARELASYYSRQGVHEFESLPEGMFSRTLMDMSSNSLVRLYVDLSTKEKNGVMTGSCTNDNDGVMTGSTDTDSSLLTPKEPEAFTTTKTKEELHSLTSKVIPIGQSYDYRLKYMIPVYFALGEDRLLQWFGMTGDNVDEEKAQERLKKAHYEIARMKQKIAAGVIKRPKQQFDPNKQDSSLALQTELSEIVKGTRAKKDRLIALMDYMVRCSKETDGQPFFRGHNNILHDNYDLFAGVNSERGKIKSVSEVLGIFCSDFLFDKTTGKAKPGLDVFRLIERGKVGFRESASTWDINPKYKYLLDL